MVALPAVAQERAPWLVTCTKAGKVLYRERLAERPSPTRESEIYGRYVGATCVVLAPEDGTAVADVPSDLREVLEGFKPGVTPAGPRKGPSGSGIDAALRVLRGEEVPIGSPVVRERTPAAKPERLGVEVALDPGEEAKADAPPPDAKPPSPAWVRLSLYKGIEEEDVIADWRRILAADPTFARFSPLVSEVGAGYLMLAAGPVRGKDRAGLCAAAAEMRLDCEPGDGVVAESSTREAILALEKSYPGHVDPGAGLAISRRVMGADAPMLCSFAVPGTKRDGVDLVALGARTLRAREAPAVVAASAAPSRVQKAGRGASSRDSRSAASISASTSAIKRSASPVIR